MIFPYYLNLEEMVVHVWEAFKQWKMDGMMPPPSPRLLLVDYQVIYQDFVNVDTKEAALSYPKPRSATIARFAFGQP